MRLFEVIQLLEYNKGATLNNWGERIAQAAKFNRKYISDQFFNNFDGEMEYEGHDPEDDGDIANVVLMNLERMDPTPNKQYVMTLVRWYIGNSKKFKQLQQDYTEWRRDTNFDIYGEYDHPDSQYPEDIRDLEDFADEFDDFENDMSNYVMDAENLNTFKLEDADQIRDALETYERIKPQLQPNERDIGRFKSFYRFEDFVDSKNSFDADDGEIKDDLNRSDVKVLYNGPLGTVTVPKSEEASCLLGKGTKWCTASTRGDNWFDHYNKKGDLIIYNEKPGNNKYQFHVTLDGIEARDARDRLLSFSQQSHFINEHPIMSKVIKGEQEKIFATMAQQPWTTDAITNDGGDPTRLVRHFIKFNEKHKGGVMRYVDEYYVKFALPSILDSRVTIPNREMVDLMLTYAKQRGKPWPEMMALMMQILRKAAERADFSSNIELKSINRLVAQLDTVVGPVGNNPELEQFKAEMIDKIKASQVGESNVYKADREFPTYELWNFPKHPTEFGERVMTTQNLEDIKELLRGEMSNISRVLKVTKNGSYIDLPEFGINSQFANEPTRESIEVNSNMNEMRRLINLVESAQLNELMVRLSSDKKFQRSDTYKNYLLYVTKEKFKDRYYISKAAHSNGETFKAGGSDVKASGASQLEALDNLRDAIDELLNAQKVTRGATIDFNKQFVQQLLIDPQIPFYAHFDNIGGEPVLVIAGDDMTEFGDELRQLGFKRSAIRTSASDEYSTATPLPSLNFTAKQIEPAGLIANARYIIGDSHSDRDGNTIYELTYHSTVHTASDKRMLNVPALTVGTARV